MAVCGKSILTTGNKWRQEAQISRMDKIRAAEEIEEGEGSKQIHRVVGAMEKVLAVIVPTLVHNVLESHC